MNLKRFLAVFKARNLEFFRDRSSLSWNLIFPVVLLVGFAFVFSGDGRAVYKVGVINGEASATQFSKTKYIEFVNYPSESIALLKLGQHNIDLLLDITGQRYWVNELSPKSYMAEQVFVAANDPYQRHVTQGEKIRYVDWVLPGILGMNMMFSSLFGVGYVIVRYRKNAVLKRLKATPLTAIEFVSAQLISRLFIVLFMSAVIYIGCNWFFNFYMLGSYFDLIIVAVLGSMSLISLGLLIACRSKSEELTGGLLNLASWPMMMLSGVWFSLEGAPEFVKQLAQALPLTHMIDAARRVMTEGATLTDLAYPLSMLVAMTVVFLLIGASLFSWNTDR